MDVIESTQNPLVKLLRSLERREKRRESGLFVAEGLVVLGEAERAGWTPEALLVDAERLGEEAVQIAVAPHRASGARLVAASRRVMTTLSSQDNVSPVIAVFRHRVAPPPRPNEVTDTWLCLEAPRDPGNLGTIIRTAHAAGAQGLMLLGPACDPYGREAVRAAMGSIFHLPIATIDEAALERLAEAWPGDIVAADPRAAEDFRRSYRRPAMILLGSERTGLSPGVRALATRPVAIPMPGGAESLNLAVAAALLLYELLPLSPGEAPSG
jgi:RNA methyltransferase, TrmH family